METRPFTVEEQAYLARIMARKQTPPTEAQREEARRSREAVHRALEAAGVTEDDIIADLEEIHRARKAARMQSPSNGHRP